MLGRDYLKFNDTDLFWAKSNKEKYSHIETKAVSEAGTTLDIVTRLNIPTYSYTFRVTSQGFDVLLAICSLAQGTLYINGDTGHVVMPRLQNKDMVPNSELTEGTDGLFDVGINFYEV